MCLGVSNIFNKIRNTCRKNDFVTNMQTEKCHNLYFSNSIIYQDIFFPEKSKGGSCPHLPPPPPLATWLYMVGQPQERV